VWVTVVWNCLMFGILLVLVVIGLTLRGMM
jgi:hypothetical protein